MAEFLQRHFLSVRKMSEFDETVNLYCFDKQGHDKDKQETLTTPDRARERY